MPALAEEDRPGPGRAANMDPEEAIAMPKILFYAVIFNLILYDCMKTFSPMGGDMSEK
jgi:hypothetical protein